ncbi:hypothetical protein D918_00093 [Trichuris suis]|nr:hypothetical protein D918_00093 [Trichuris suis]
MPQMREMHARTQQHKLYFTSEIMNMSDKITSLLQEKEVLDRLIESLDRELDQLWRIGVSKNAELHDAIGRTEIAVQTDQLCTGCGVSVRPVMVHITFERNDTVLQFRSDTDMRNWLSQEHSKNQCADKELLPEPCTELKLEGEINSALNFGI